MLNWRTESCFYNEKGSSMPLDTQGKSRDDGCRSGVRPSATNVRGMLLRDTKWNVAILLKL